MISGIKCLERRTRDCPCCGHGDKTNLYANCMAPIDGVDLSYVVRQCKRCLSAFADGLAHAEAYDWYYSSCSKYDFIPDVSHIPHVHFARARIAAEIVAAVKGRVDSVLDLGCGVGTLLQAFRSKGARRLAGLDPAPNSPDAAARLFGLHGVGVGSWIDAPDRLDLSSFDAVCLTGVLEHLADVGHVFAMLRTSMRKDAVLLLEVPAAERFTDEPLEPFGEFSLEHVNYFCTTGIRSLAAREGFGVLTQRVVAIGPGVTPSLFSVLQVGADRRDEIASCWSLESYIRTSEIGFDRCLERFLAASRHGPLTLYGAGSHTARLLGALDSRRLRCDIVRIVDSNPNLVGRRVGKWAIESPGVLATRSGSTIVVSSFRSQKSIAHWLRSNVPDRVVELYGDRDFPEVQGS